MIDLTQQANTNGQTRRVERAQRGNERPLGKWCKMRKMSLKIMGETWGKHGETRKKLYENNDDIWWQKEKHMIYQKEK